MYLLLTSVISIIFLNGSYLRFINTSSGTIVLNFKGIWISGQKVNPDLGLCQITLSGLTILIAVIALTSIFLYRKRKIQMKLTMTLIITELLLILLLTYYAFSIISSYHAIFVPTLYMLFPALCLIFSILAHSAISKDENIVRSYDRLR